MTVRKNRVEFDDYFFSHTPFFFFLFWCLVFLDTHLAFTEAVAELERIRLKTIHDGQLFRQYQEEVTDSQFEQEICQAEEEYLVRPPLPLFDLSDVSVRKSANVRV